MTKRCKKYQQILQYFMEVAVFPAERVCRDRMLESGDPALPSADRRGPEGDCMRSIGTAERALELMRRRSLSRRTFDTPIAENANIQDWIAESRIDLEMATLLKMKTAWLMDTVGNRHARAEIAAIKVAAPQIALRVIDRAIQVHGAGGVSADFPLAEMWAQQRTLRLADGPDEVHKRTIARQELRRYEADQNPSAPPSA